LQCKGTKHNERHYTVITKSAIANVRNVLAAIHVATTASQDPLLTGILLHILFVFSTMLEHRSKLSKLENNM